MANSQPSTIEEHRPRKEEVHDRVTVTQFDLWIIVLRRLSGYFCQYYMCLSLL